MAANALPLLALAGAAFVMASRSKGGSAPVKSASANAGANAPFLVLNSNCEPIAVPTDEAEKKRQADAIRSYVGRRAVELYQQMAGGAIPVKIRFNTGPLTAEQRQYLEGATDVSIEIKDGYILATADSADDIYRAVYDELVPAACAQKGMWSAETGEFDTISPSPAAACIAAGIRVQVNQTLASVAGNIPALSVAEIAETMLACVGINLDIG